MDLHLNTLMKACDVLLVDDSYTDTEIAISSFRNYQFTCSVATALDGERGLDYLYRRGTFQERSPGNPSLILLDIKMPRLDGFEVLRRIKADLLLKQIPVIMFTSSRQDNDILRAYKLGANGYVVKPVDYEEMKAAVRKIFEFWLNLNVSPREKNA